MDKAQTSKGRLRFRLYYRLMDVCLVFAVIGSIWGSISPYDRPEDAPALQELERVIELRVAPAHALLEPGVLGGTGRIAARRPISAPISG